MDLQEKLAARRLERKSEAIDAGIEVNETRAALMDKLKVASQEKDAIKARLLFDQLQALPKGTMTFDKEKWKQDKALADAASREIPTRTKTLAGIGLGLGMFLLVVKPILGICVVVGSLWFVVSAVSKKKEEIRRRDTQHFAYTDTPPPQ